ncbi:CoA ester lyase [Methylobacterium sp. NEAU 140]|uniref:HpcH/HpaI aldolase/citrate lyase family protein n=1 Tax=Methylobacterium sp. NEAU 140 TaxID=3064945 RepID=UPI002733302B|nr:CoA ester lyase [Methylobacterium sp. NEAU 140]MDP4023980.1 CoA ester lyase [Methylobacterium sp. NEAU 140]
MPQPTRPFRLQRSELAVPATSERFFAKAAAGAADVVFLDLEDAVAPARKAQARAGAIAALNGHDWGDKTLALRVNGLDTPWAHRDIIDVVSAAPRLDLILLPKAESGFDVRFVDQLLTGLEREHGRDKRLGIEVLIETARGVAQVEEIAAASDRLEALIFGVGDYSIEMRTFDTAFGQPNPAYAVRTHGEGAGQRHWNDQWHFALARIANAARANGLRPIDGPYANFADAEGYRNACERAAALGYEGKWAIHPSQVALANAAFSPAPALVAAAEAIEAALERSVAEGAGAVGHGGLLVDMAHAKLAAALLGRHRAIRARDGAVS